MTKAFTHGSTDKTVCLNYYLFQHKNMETKPKNDCCTTINENNVFSYRFSHFFDQLLNLTLIVIPPHTKHCMMYICSDKHVLRLSWWAWPPVTCLPCPFQ